MTIRQAWTAKIVPNAPKTNGRNPSSCCLRGLPCASRPKLPQMVIEVFVHSAAPGLRSERAKKWMRMAGTLRFSALVKLPDFLLELSLFKEKVALIGDH